MNAWPSWPAGNTPEMRLLVAACRSLFEAEQQDAVRALAGGPLDWNAVARLARRNKLRPVLYRALAQACPEMVPATILDAWRAASRAIAAQNLLLSKELVRLVASLDAAGVSALPLKGPVLAVSAYGRLDIREMVDLDLLLPEAHLPAARDTMLREGYVPQAEEVAADDAWFLRNAYDYHFAHPQRRVLVEIHWRIAPGSFSIPLDFEELRPRCQDVTLEGRPLPCLSPEDPLLALCVHGIKHFVFGTPLLSHVMDVAAVIHKHPVIDGDWLERQAGRLGCRCILRLMLGVSAAVLAVPLPRHATERLQSDRVSMGLAHAALNAMGPDSAAMWSARTKHAFYLRSRERWRDRLRYSRHLARRHDSEGVCWRVPLPAAVATLYCLLMPVWMPARWVARGITRLRHSGLALSRRPK